ncbi:hypothetical protein NQ315_003741 [Exocentrus adspersus]|uniref:Lipase domain-containing protein n=1 Tax=Exocentrus adspersus TaxID=1586481 RepID=A0AAV8VHM8_9CUCU|nr:hypothetical protein NQ315_003741 [Exocentrus adspersus]
MVRIAIGGIWNMWDIEYWRCVMKTSHECPDNDIKFYLYTHDTGQKRLRIDVRNRYSLKYAGFDPLKKNVIIIHGFNGTESKSPITTLRNAYLSRTDYNIFTVDWKELTRFPCYISALSNTRLVSQCTAKLYAFIMDQGGDATETTCVGHSLGAHICGMVSNHLNIKQHKIVGRCVWTRQDLLSTVTLIENSNSPEMMLIKCKLSTQTPDFLGDINQIGHVDFCVNGGRLQPNCKGNRLRRARCSHFQSACYFAQTVKLGTSMIGKPCVARCPKISSNWGFLPGRSIPMGHDTPFGYVTKD